MTNGLRSCAAAANSSGSVTMSILVAVAVLLCVPTQSVTALNVENGAQPANATDTSNELVAPTYKATVQWAEQDGNIVFLLPSTSHVLDEARAPVKFILDSQNPPTTCAIKHVYSDSAYHQQVLRGEEPFNISETRRRLVTPITFCDKVYDRQPDGSLLFRFHELRRTNEGTPYGSIHDLEWFQIDQTRVHMEMIRTEAEYEHVKSIISSVMGVTFNCDAFLEKLQSNGDVVMSHHDEFPVFAIQDLDTRLPSAADALSLTISLPLSGLEGINVFRELYKALPSLAKPQTARDHLSIFDPAEYSPDCKRTPFVVQFEKDDMNALRNSLRKSGKWMYPKSEDWYKMSNDPQGFKLNFGNMIMHKTVKSIHVEDTSITRNYSPLENSVTVKFVYNPYHNSGQEKIIEKSYPTDDNAWNQHLFSMWEAIRGTRLCEIKRVEN
eukprot:Lankesteria_metandrocarpae@DN5235_c0_g1_i1.p1